MSNKSRKLNQQYLKEYSESQKKIYSPEGVFSPMFRWWSGTQASKSKTGVYIVLVFLAAVFFALMVAFKSLA